MALDAVADAVGARVAAVTLDLAAAAGDAAPYLEAFLVSGGGGGPLLKRLHMASTPRVGGRCAIWATADALDGCTSKLTRESRCLLVDFLHCKVAVGEAPRKCDSVALDWALGLCE